MTSTGPDTSGGASPPPAGGPTPAPAGGGLSVGERWARIGGIAAIVGIPVSILIAFVQGTAGSHDSRNFVAESTSSAPSTVIVNPPPTSTPVTSTRAPVTSSSVGAQPRQFSSGSVDLQFAFLKLGVRMTTPGSWVLEFSFDADLGVSESGVSPGPGNSLTAFGKQKPSYQDCRDRVGDGSPLPWDEVPSGTHLCIQLEQNRTGYARVDYESGASGIAHIKVSGLVWQQG